MVFGYSISQIRKALAAFLGAFFAAIPALHWIADVEPFDGGTLLAALLSAVVAGYSAFKTPNAV